MPRSDVPAPVRRPKAMIFDVGGVLLTADAAVLRDAAASVGCDRDADRGTAAFARALCAGQLSDLRSLSQERFLRLWREEWGVPPTVAAQTWDAVALLTASGRELECVVPGDAHRALGDIRAAGIRLAVMSNSDGRVADRLRAVGLADYFEVVHDSALIGLAKPDPRCYEATAARMGLPLADCWYVTDMVRDVAAGADRIGLGGAVVIDPMMTYPRRGDVVYCRGLTDLARLVLSS